MRTRVFNSTDTAWVRQDGTQWDAGHEELVDLSRNAYVAQAVEAGQLADLGAPDATPADAPAPADSNGEVA